VRIIKDVALQQFLTGKDTLKAESKESIARTYYNVNTAKVELQLKGKIFDVPINIDKKVITNKKEVIRKSNVLPFWVYLVFAAMLIFDYFLIIKKKK
jgi:hypothetical protein